MEQLNKKQERYLKYKRFNAFLGAIFLFIILIPLYLLVLLINLIVTKGHPFFLQERYGYQCHIFKIYKFRTMDESGHSTLWGRFIRFTSIDELPQLFNIIKGEMTFIGPRPLSIEENNMDELRKELKPSPYLVKPGLTGYAQINYNPHEDETKKADYDKYYVEHMSFWFDIKIVLLTIFKLVPITIHHKK